MSVLVLFAAFLSEETGGARLTSRVLRDRCLSLRPEVELLDPVAIPCVIFWGALPWQLQHFIWPQKNPPFLRQGRACLFLMGRLWNSVILDF